MTIGELCAGYGGLGMAVEEVFGARLAWVSEYETAPSKILAHHWPDVPNHGDMTRIDWAAVEPVDIISGGTPCQDLSGAGKRAGMTEGTRSNLWVQMREAIAVIRPRFVVWENVRGAYSACADSEMGRCPRCVDPDSGVAHAPNLRALGRVVGDLADLGYDAAWCGITAAGVGAPHKRSRVFVLAWAAAENADRATRSERRVAAPGQAEVGRARPDTRRRSGAPTPDTESFGRERARDSRQRRDGPPHVSDASPDADDQGPQGPQSARRRVMPGRGTATHTPGSGRDEGPAESAAAAHADGINVVFQSLAVTGGLGPTEPAEVIQWGVYEPAIRRWEAVLGREAPAPTETGPKGGQRLSPRAVEWMMGLPAGHVTAVPGISRNEQLKALGNGVVPAQAAAALRILLPHVATA